MPIRTASTALTLARWLGPWSKGAAPRGIPRTRERLSIGAGVGRSDGALRSSPAHAYVYTPPSPRAVYLVLPGLHFLGPDDPRLDRFCRVLASAGFLVVAPTIRSYADLVLDASAFEDARAALDLATSCAAERGLPRPTVFSVSFGSALALELATLGDAGPANVIVFGGFCEFLPTVRFALTGRAEHDGRVHTIARDPLNSPVVFLNALHGLALTGDRARLAAAWREMVYRTWGRMELKAPGARDPYAHAIAAALPPELRRPFYRGCMLEDGGIPWLEEALATGAHDLLAFDPGDRLARAACPVSLVHGREDDVIPYVETLKLAAALPPSRLAAVHLTGLFSHTSAERPTARALAAEARTMAGMLLTLAGPAAR